MSISPIKGMEPIAGYCLVEKIGDGGFGEVWKVTAPGGLFKALKIIYGNLSGPRAEQELRSLERIKAVRHPFLLSLERFEVVEDRLLIVTELADRSLSDRFAECIKSGLRGVPREELLGYLRDAADALDYLSEAHGLQHLDVKPQNLLLLSGRIKVADFGLVKNLLGTSASITGGVTPVYAAPEVFDGRVSRYSDQYSLAIAYQELLTGTRPFPGQTPLQLATQHISSPPILGPLPPQDQPVIARALAKAPEQRFPSCGEMVALLSRPAPDAVAAPVGRPPAPPPPFPDGPPGEATTPLGMVGVLPPPPGPLADTAPRPTGRPSAALATGAGALRPTLFVGLGGVGGTVLRLLRRRLRCRLGGAAALPIFQTLLLDTDRAGIRAAQSGEPDEALDPEETLLCPLKPPDHYRPQARALLRWLDRRWLHGIPRSLRPEGVRPLGRLALLDNAPAVLDRLREAVSRLAADSARAAAVGATGRALRDEAPRVFVVASVAGGTGGGMLWDVAYVVRQVLAERNLPDTGVCGLLVYGTTPSPDEQYRARVNAYATLQELDHWCRPDVSFPGAPEQGLSGFGPGRPPFDECYLAHLGDGLSEGAAAAAADRVAEYLCLDATAGGACLDRLRHESRCAGGLRTFGLAGVDFARGALVEAASQLLCRRVVRQCQGDLAAGDRERLEQEADERLNELGVRLGPLAERLRQSLDSAVGERGRPLPSLTASDPGRPPGADDVARLLQEVESLLDPAGGPEPGTDGGPPRESPRQIGERLGDSLIEWLLDKVEDPDARLGAAMCCFDRVLRQLREEADGGRARLVNCRGRRHNLRRRLLEGPARAKGGALDWIGLGRMRSSRTLSRFEQMLAAYADRRQEELALEGALAAIEAVATRLAPLHDLKLCRQRVGQFADLFAERPTEADPRAAGLTPLVPFGADGLGAAAEALVAQVPPETIRGLGAQLQTEVFDVRGGLLGVVGNPLDSPSPQSDRSAGPAGFWELTGPGRELAAELREQVLVRSRAVVHCALTSADAAGLFLERHGSAEQARQAVVGYVDKSRPRLAQAEMWQYAVLALPTGQAAETLRGLTAEALAGIPLTVVEGYEAAVFVQETVGLSVAAVTTALCGNDPGCAELAARVRTRDDVAWSDQSGVVVSV
jgi:hypothetical protein